MVVIRKQKKKTDLSSISFFLIFLYNYRRTYQYQTDAYNIDCVIINRIGFFIFFVR